MKRTAVFIVLICGILFGVSAFADSHVDIDLDPGPDIDPALDVALRVYEHRDYKKALKLLIPVAERGEVEAQFLVGRIYLLGLATKKDKNKAKEWFRKAAKQGHPRAQYELSELLEIGDRKQLLELVKLLRSAAKCGVVPAQTKLSYKYAFGIGVSQSASKETYWMRKAAYQGEKFARGELAFEYFHGVGAKKDHVLALMWVILAAKSGHTAGKRWIKTFSERMTSEQVREAKRLAKLW